MNQHDFTTIPLTEWDALRLQQATGPEGPLAVVAMHPITTTEPDGPPAALDGVPGRWAHPRDTDHVVLTASPDEDITVDGAPAERETTLGPTQQIRFTPTRTGRIGREVHGTYYLQVFDSAAEARRTFDRIQRYPEDPGWILEAEYHPHGSAVDVGTATDPTTTHRRAAPGIVRVLLDGRTCDLVCMETFVPDMLMIVLVDATSGPETPAQGRSYLLPHPAPGPITLDLNRLMLMPHAFSPAVPCPTAPLGNRLPIAVPAGEKHVLFTH